MPPVLFLGALLLGYLLTRYFPIGPGLATPNALGLTVGLIFVVAGFALAFLSVRRFRLAGTSVVPGEPAAALVTVGPYRVTRNPIYVGFVLVYFGMAIVLTSLWTLPAPPARARDPAARRDLAGGGVSRAQVRRRLSQIRGARAPLALRA